MDTVTIRKNEYKELKAAKYRLDELSNIRRPQVPKKRKSFAYFVDVLKDMEKMRRELERFIIQ